MRGNLVAPDRFDYSYHPQATLSSTAQLSQKMKAFSGSPKHHESPTECSAVHCRRSSHTLRRRIVKSWGIHRL